MDHSATQRRLYDLLNVGDIEGFGVLLAEGFVEHEETPGLGPTKEGVLEFFRMYRDTDGKPLVWPVPLCIGWGLACVAVPFRWHAQTVAAIYQGLGAALTALGLAAIGDRIRRVRETTTAAIATTRSGVGG